jgi:hypothetical protein
MVQGENMPTVGIFVSHKPYAKDEGVSTRGCLAC